jgi:hypothetical protein
MAGLVLRDDQVQEESQALFDEAQKLPPASIQEEDPSGAFVDATAAKLLDPAQPGKLYDLLRELSKVPGLPNDGWSLLFKHDKMAVRLAAMELLCSMDPNLLRSLIKGTLLEEEPHLQGFLKPLQPKAADEKASSIYLNCFVNRSGKGPSKEELLRIVDVVERYVEDEEDELAKAIDHQISIGHFQWKKGHRRYLMDRNKTWKQGRKENILLFCASLRRRFEVSGSTIRVLTEAGYTIGPSKRAGEHAKHSSSNYLMNLFEAAAKYLGLSYRMKFLVVLHCFRPSHGAIGEMVVTRLAQAYTSYAGGSRTTHTSEARL